MLHNPNTFRLHLGESILNNIHTPMKTLGALGFSILDQTGIKPTTFKLVDNLFFLLSYRHSYKKASGYLGLS